MAAAAANGCQVARHKETDLLSERRCSFTAVGCDRETETERKTEKERESTAERYIVHIVTCCMVIAAAETWTVLLII